MIAQDGSKHRGSIIRIHLDGKIPKDNPKLINKIYVQTEQSGDRKIVSFQQDFVVFCFFCVARMNCVFADIVRTLCFTMRNVCSARSSMPLSV